MPRSRGRRPGGAVGAEMLAAIARDQFAERGYPGTTIRSVAAAAGVDPALVLYHHGSKRDLFLAAAAMPFDSSALAAELAAGDPHTVGERLIRFLLEAVQDAPTRRVFRARIRAAMTEPEAAALVRDLIADDLVGPLVRHLGSDQPELRAALVSTQLIGYIVARWVLQIAPLDQADDAAVTELAPTLQRYLVDPL